MRRRNSWSREMTGDDEQIEIRSRAIRRLVTRSHSNRVVAHRQWKSQGDGVEDASRSRRHRLTYPEATWPRVSRAKTFARALGMVAWPRFFVSQKHLLRLLALRPQGWLTAVDLRVVASLRLVTAAPRVVAVVVILRGGREGIRKAVAVRGRVLREGGL